MDNLIGIATTLIIFQAMACLANGFVTLFLPCMWGRKVIALFVVALPSTFAALGMAGTILSSQGAAAGKVLGVSFVGWFLIFFAAQGIGTWSLVIYSAQWIYQNKIKGEG